MEKRMLASAMVLLLVAVFMADQLSRVAAQEILCKMDQDGLVACKPAVTKANPVDPSAACCAALRKADLSCLCSYPKTNPTVVKLMGIDPDLAKQLPAKCNITPPANC
uniref:Putative lipid-transfer protein DIR1 n=1 Tax=Anthurium amnicola TaxID=1678845 RepID=A0A1D1XYQ7_9ARAE